MSDDLNGALVAYFPTADFTLGIILHANGSFADDVAEVGHWANDHHIVAAPTAPGLLILEGTLHVDQEPDGEATFNGTWRELTIAEAICLAKGQPPWHTQSESSMKAPSTDDLMSELDDLAVTRAALEAQQKHSAMEIRMAHAAGHVSGETADLIGKQINDRKLELLANIDHRVAQLLKIYISGQESQPTQASDPTS